MRKLGRNPRKTNKHRRSLYSMSESKGKRKSQQTPQTPSSVHFLNPLHGNHSKGPGSLYCTQQTHPEDAGPSSYSWKFSLSLSRLDPNSIYGTNLSSSFHMTTPKHYEDRYSCIQQIFAV